MTEQPGAMERFWDTFTHAAVHSPLGGGGLARAYWRAHGYTNEQINTAISHIDQAYQQKYAKAPTIQHAKKALDALTPDNVGRAAVDIVGNVLGGVDPSYAVMPGRSVAQRILGQAAVQGTASNARQAVNLKTGMQKHYEPKEVLKDMAAGAAFQGAAEGVHGLIKGGKQVIDDIGDIVYPDAPAAPDGMPGNGSVPPMDPHKMADIMNDPAAVGKPAPQRRMNHRDAIDHEDLVPSDFSLDDTFTQNEQPSVQAQGTANEILAPEAPAPMVDIEPHPALRTEPADVLTPAERQDMDASAQMTPMDSSHEKFTPNIDEPAVPANDVSGLDAAKKFIPSLIGDERGNLTPFQEVKSLDDGTKFIDYTSKAGERIPIKMAIEPDGTAEIAIDQFSTKANRLGPKEIREAMYGLMEQYPEIKRFGGYRRSGAGAGRVQEIEPPKLDAFHKLMADERGSLGPGEEPPIPEMPEDPNHPVNKVVQAIEDARVARTQADKLRRVEVAKRAQAGSAMGQHTSGTEGYHAELSELRGKMPKADFMGIGSKLEQPDIDSLFDMVKKHPTFTYYESINARSGLAKLLGAEPGVVPTKKELELLGHVFPPEMMKGLTEDGILGGKLGEHFANALNVPRALMASMDFSAPGRQGLFLIGSKAYWTSFVDMFKAFGSKKAYDAILDNISSRPTYRLMQRSGLALTGTGKNLTEREEQFMSQWAEKIPVAGRLVQASDRAYSGYLNKLRADTFDRLAKNAQEVGINFNDNPKALRDIAKFVNAATGRGDLGKLNQAAPLLSGLLFSPRLMASRLSLLNPMFYVNLNPMVRKEALKSLLAFTGMAGTVLGLAKAAGLSVETDPRSSDFAKIKVGNTRYDMLGGFQQYIRAAAQLVSGETKSTRDGSISDLTKGQYGKDTRRDVVIKFFENKLAPVPSFIDDFLRGRDATGKKFKLTTAVEERFVPLLWQDMHDVYQDQGPEGLLAAAPAGTFGVGIQTQNGQPSKGRPKADKNFKSSFGSGFSKSDFKGAF